MLTVGGEARTMKGRSVASNGYVLIRVGKTHHLADVRGYAYEHRLVAERMLGRRLRPGEIVHHKDGNRQHNHESNLEVVASAAEHHVHHRADRERLRLPGEPNRTILCGCGCGRSLRLFDDAGRPRRFLSGHNPMPAPTISAVVEFLKRGPAAAAVIARGTGKTRKVVSVCLCKLRRRGIVTREGRQWCLTARRAA